MKKFLSVLLVAAMTLAMLVGCGSSKKDDNKETTTAETTSADETTVADDTTAADEETTVATESGVMTYAEYVAAVKDDKVVIEAYVQAKQALTDEGKVSVYAQDEDGAYFIYAMPCTAEDYEKLVAGTKIKVTGFRGEWSGEIEVVDVEGFEFEEGNFIAEAKDVTEYLGKDEIVDFQNQAVKFTDLEVVAANEENADAAFLYNWNGSGEEGDDLYFNLSNGTDTFSFVVESSLTNAESDVYAAVKNLKVGDKVDVEAFLYWYEGINPHVTAITVK